MGVAVVTAPQMPSGDETPAQTGKSVQSGAIYQPGADEKTRPMCHMCVCAAEAAINDKANRAKINEITTTLMQQ